MEQKWQLPEKLRASADPKQTAEFARLRANDIEQQELGTRINSPFTPNNPRDTIRSKAQTAIDTLTAQDELAPDQIEQLAEAYAAQGNYDLAEVVSTQNKELYAKYWEAVWREDEEDCPHPADKHFIKEYIFSMKHGRELELVACNVCGFLNVTEPPELLAKQREIRNEKRGLTKGMSIDQARQWHKQNVKL